MPKQLVLAIYHIQRFLASLSQGTMTILGYYTKIKGLWDELDDYRTIPICDQYKAHLEQREEDHMMQFLIGLNDTFCTICNKILMITPLPNAR